MAAKEKHQKEKEDKQLSLQKAKQLLIAQKAVDQAILLTNPLQDFQEAMRANPEENAYVQQMNALLQARCKEMMKQAMNWLTTEEAERGEPSFTMNDVKNAMAELVTKTRMLIYLCASRVSLQSGPENAVTTALMVAAWCVVLSCIHTNPGAWGKHEDHMHGLDTAERSSLCDQGPIWALTGQAVTTASRDAGAQARDTGRLQPPRAMQARRYA